jgi:hypothetical protein
MQGLEAQEASDAAHPAAQDLSPPPVLLPDHPSSKLITMTIELHKQHPANCTLHIQTQRPGR